MKLVFNTIFWFISSSEIHFCVVFDCWKVSKKILCFTVKNVFDRSIYRTFPQLHIRLFEQENQSMLNTAAVEMFLDDSPSSSSDLLIAVPTIIQQVQLDRKKTTKCFLWYVTPSAHAVSQSFITHVGKPSLSSRADRRLWLAGFIVIDMKVRASPSHPDFHLYRLFSQC